MIRAVENDSVDCALNERRASTGVSLQQRTGIGTASRVQHTRVPCLSPIAIEGASIQLNIPISFGTINTTSSHGKQVPEVIRLLNPHLHLHHRAKAATMPLQLQPQEIRVSDHLSLLKWKRQLRAILLTEDAWKVICGEMDKPTHEDPTDKTFRRDLDKWRKLNNIALGWMLLTLEDYSRQSVERFTEPLDAMENLFEKFTPPFMTFREFIGIDDPRSPHASTTPMRITPAVLVETSNGGNRPSRELKHKPRDEMFKVGSDKENNLSQNGAAIIEAPSSPPRRTIKEARSFDALLTPKGIHNFIKREKVRSPTPDSTGSQATIRRKGILEKLTGSRPTSPHPHSDRASLTLHSADINRTELPHPDTFENEGEILLPCNDIPPRSSAYTDSSLVIPDRSVSLARSDLAKDGAPRRHRGTHVKTGRRSHDALFEEGPYMMSGALQYVSKALWHQISECMC